MSRIGWLANPIDWRAVYDAYQPPRRSEEPVPERITDDLRAMWEIAPAFFRDRLCGLTGVFLDDSAEAPWGYRENPKQFSFQLPPAHYGRYVAFPSAPFIPLGMYETALTTHLLGRPAQIIVDADSTAMMVLAMLAHEDGHILFRQVLAPNYEPIDPQRFCDGQFWAGSWSSPVELALVKGIATYASEHRVGPQIWEVLADPGQLARLFTGKRWVSLLASFTPEHDFVETYVADVLAQAKTPLGAMRLMVDGMTVELLAGLENQHTEIGRKAACFNWMWK